MTNQSKMTSLIQVTFFFFEALLLYVPEMNNFRGKIE